MSEPDQGQPHEIIIVRRRGGDDHDDHHGGVWKVAFADFMTAMMAFFLVLWIVNSTTKQTRSSLARYFNPIRLSDTTPARKGLNDPREVDFDASSEGHGKTESPASKKEQAKPDVAEARIDAPRQQESAASVGQKTGDTEPATRPKVDRASQDSFLDPFAVRKPIASTPPAPSAQGGQASGKGADEARALKAAVESKVGEAALRELKGKIDVEASSEGLLISLTDRADMGAFAIGSSDAADKLGLVMSAIADALRARPGAVVIRGHTDSRPYRRSGYDNWQLSFDRAQTGFTGLVRGGLDERRIERVEAYADRRPKNVTAPQAPENRRIEILLRKQGPS